MSKSTYIRHTKSVRRKGDKVMQTLWCPGGNSTQQPGRGRGLWEYRFLPAPTWQPWSQPPGNRLGNLTLRVKFPYKTFAWSANRISNGAVERARTEEEIGGNSNIVVVRISTFVSPSTNQLSEARRRNRTMDEPKVIRIPCLRPCTRTLKDTAFPNLKLC